MSLVEEYVMAKPKRNDIPAKIDQEVIRLAKIVAAYRSISLAEYLSERLRPLVESDLAKHQREEKREQRRTSTSVDN
jgi:hypothetical protein